MKKSIDLTKGTYIKINSNPNLCKNNELNDYNHNIVNREVNSSKTNTEYLHNEIAIKEPPVHIQRKKKIITKKKQGIISSNNDSNNKWIKHSKTSINNENPKNNKIKNNTLTENEDILLEQNEEINEIKESVICYICLSKVVQPEMCPYCHKIAYKECLKNWFIKKGNKNCRYYRREILFDKII